MDASYAHEYIIYQYFIAYHPIIGQFWIFICALILLFWHLDFLCHHPTLYKIYKTLINLSICKKCCSILLRSASCLDKNAAKELFYTCDSPNLNLILWTKHKNPRKQGWMMASRSLQVRKWLTDHRETCVVRLHAQQSACFPTHIYTGDAREQTSENRRMPRQETPAPGEFREGTVLVWMQF